MRRQLVLTLLFCIATVLAIGCDQLNQAVVQPAVEEASAEMTRGDLQSVGIAYHSYHDAFNQGPPGWDEFISFADENGMDADAIRKVQSAGYQMQWNVRFRDVTQGLSNTVMAENPSGGPKLYMDGSVQ